MEERARIVERATGVALKMAGIFRKFAECIQSFGLGIILVASLCCLCPWVRCKVFYYASVRKKKWADDVWKHFGNVLMLSYLWIFSLPVLIVCTWFAKGEWLLETIALGAILAAFVAVELPRLLKPNFVVVMLRSTDKGYVDIPLLKIRLKGGRRYLLFFRLTNVGTTFCNNCQCWFVFDPGFMPVEDEGLYEGIDFRKLFEVQKQNRCAKFPPDKNYLGVAPTNHMVFPLWVQTPTEVGAYRVRVLVQSESTWGEFGTHIHVEVIRCER